MSEDNQIEALQQRIMLLIEIQKNERAELAGKIRDLLKENESLKKQVLDFEIAQKLRGDVFKLDYKRAESDIGLDFSLPEDRY